MKRIADKPGCDEYAHSSIRNVYYDDALHSGTSEGLENGHSVKGIITISGGCLTLDYINATASSTGVVISVSALYVYACGGGIILPHKIETGMSAKAIDLGSKSASFASVSSSDKSLDAFGNLWE